MIDQLKRARQVPWLMSMEDPEHQAERASQDFRRETRMCKAVFYRNDPVSGGQRSAGRVFGSS